MCVCVCAWSICMPRKALKLRKFHRVSFTNDSSNNINIYNSSNKKKENSNLAKHLCIHYNNRKRFQSASTRIVANEIYWWTRIHTHHARRHIHTHTCNVRLIQQYARNKEMKENRMSSDLHGVKSNAMAKKKLWGNTSQTFLLLVHKIYKADLKFMHLFATATEPSRVEHRMQTRK